MALRSGNAVVLAKVEPTAGVDSSPVAGTDAVLVENPTIRFKPNVGQINEVTGSLDGRGFSSVSAVKIESLIDGSATARAYSALAM